MTPDRKAFQRARRDLVDLVCTPVDAWHRTPPRRRTDAAYTALLTVPLDLAAAGFTVTVSQSGAGWCLEIRRVIADGYELHIHAEAHAYAAALFQLADAAPIALEDLHAHARRAAGA